MTSDSVTSEVLELSNELLRHQELTTEAWLTDRIGVGSYGTVYKAVENSSGLLIAVKIVRFDTVREKEKSIEEAEIQSTLDHENIVKLFKYYMKENFLIMHLEYFDGVVLLEFLCRGWVLGQRKCIKKKIIEGIKCGIEYLHNQNIAHGDLHNANVMVDCNGEVKLIDFGLADYNIFKIARDCEKAEELYQKIEAAKTFHRSWPGT